MNRLSLLLLAMLALLAASCASKRTVLSGPKEIGLDEDDYDPRDKEKNENLMRKAAAMGMEGQIEKQGGRGFMQRYGKVDTEGAYKGDYNHSQMEGKIFSGNLKESSLKSYNQTRDFVTKNFSGGKEYRTKDYGAASSEAREMRTDIRQAGSAIEDGELFVDRTQPVRTGAAQGADRAFATSTSHQDGKTFPVNNYLPAEREMDRDRYPVRDAPAYIQSTVSSFVKGRTTKNPATVQEINDLVGKQR